MRIYFSGFRRHYLEDIAVFPCSCCKEMTRAGLNFMWVRSNTPEPETPAVMRRVSS
jgi:hypothetical protein